MPRISSFYGIVIWMYFDEPQHEGRPHFHATYGDDEAAFDIDGIELIAGGLPRRAQKMVTEWARDHQEGCVRTGIWLVSTSSRRPIDSPAMSPLPSRR
jgi:hypothetical protein